MSSWRELQAELDLWQEAGRIASFWWRDDDAIAPTPELERLIKTAGTYDVPLALAIIPQAATDELAKRLERVPLANVLQHGFSHENHAPADEKKTEFGPQRTSKAMLGDIYAGAKLLARFSNRSAVFVPPWNRIDKKLLPALPGFGIRGISGFAPRKADDDVPGLVRVNSHIDPVNWRSGRKFIGERPVLARIIAHLAARRLGEVDSDEPTGLLSHHLVHDEACWEFIAHLVDLTHHCRAVKWLSADQAFGFEK